MRTSGTPPPSRPSVPRSSSGWPPWTLLTWFSLMKGGQHGDDADAWAGTVGERVETTTPGPWENVTLIVGVRQEGVVASLAFEGATDQLVFRTYVQEVLVPELHPGDVVVWDN